MARTGRFGRLPRTAPDLSSAIASLLREMQNQEDQNFLDAWTNGGMVDGKPVDDARLLAHFRQRRDALDKDDPMWDEWDNRIQQYEFSIADSKMKLKWDQEKVSEEEMAAFYQKWAGTAPYNSAFSREMRSAAAKWRTSADAKKKEKTAAEKQKEHDRWVKSYYNGHVRVGETIQMRLVEIAKVYGAMPMSGDGLEDLNPDAEGYGRFMDIYVDGRTNDPYVQDIIDDVEREARRIDPGFRFDKRHIDNALRRADGGLQTLSERSLYKTEREGWQDRRGGVRASQNQLEDAPIIKRVFDAQQLFDENVQACNGDPGCELQAAVHLRDRLAKQGRKLMQGGVEDTNIEITAALAATQRQLDAVIAGEPIDPMSVAARDTTIFDLSAPAEQRGGFVSALAVSAANYRATHEGGWVSTIPNTDQFGDPVLDDAGDPTFHYDVHPPGELVPLDFIPVQAEHSLTGAPPGLKLFAKPVPVTVQPIAPDGTPLSPGDVVYTRTALHGTVVEQPQSDYARPIYFEIAGLMGPDGKARTTYRTGTNASADPADVFLYHNTAPTIIDPATGQPAQPRADPNAPSGTPGARVFSARAVPAMTNDGTPYYTVSLDPFEKAIAPKREPLTNGGYGLGTSLTAAGAANQVVLDDLWAIGKGRDAVEQAEAMTASMLRDAADPFTDAIASAGLTADAKKIVRTTEAQQRGLHGMALEGAWATESDVTPGMQPFAEQLIAEGQGPEDIGYDEFARKTALLKGLDDAHANDPKPMSAYGPEAEEWAARYAQWDVDPGVVAQRKYERKRAAILDPARPSLAIKVPGMPRQRGQPLFSGLGDWVGRMGVMPPNAMPGDTLDRNPLSAIGSGPSMMAQPFPDPVQPMTPRVRPGPVARTARDTNADVYSRMPEAVRRGMGGTQYELPRVVQGPRPQQQQQQQQRSSSTSPTVRYGPRPAGYKPVTYSSSNPWTRYGYTTGGGWWGTPGLGSASAPYRGGSGAGRL